MASAILSAWRMFCSVWPTKEPIRAPTSSTIVGRPTSLPSALADGRLLPQPGGTKQQDAPGWTVGFASERGRSALPAEVFERLQSAQVGEPFACPGAAATGRSS